MPTRRPQAQIVHVGTVGFSGEDNVTEVRDWVFRHAGDIPEVDWTRDGRMLLFGYTAIDLAEIASRRKEWE